MACFMYITDHGPGQTIDKYVFLSLFLMAHIRLCVSIISVSFLHVYRCSPWSYRFLTTQQLIIQVPGSEINSKSNYYRDLYEHSLLYIQFQYRNV